MAGLNLNGLNVGYGKMGNNTSNEYDFQCIQCPSSLLSPMNTNLHPVNSGKSTYQSIIIMDYAKNIP